MQGSGVYTCLIFCIEGVKYVTREGLLGDQLGAEADNDTLTSEFAV